MTHGIDLWDVLLEQVGHDTTGLDVTIFCNVMSVKDAGRVRAALDSGRFRSVRVVGDRGAFVLRQGSDDGQMHNAGDIEDTLGLSRLRGINTHLKAIIWQGPASGCLVTSANLNHNNRPECHDRADYLAPTLLAIADELFAALPPGLTPAATIAFSGVGIGLDVATRRWPGVFGVDYTPAAEAGIYITKGIGVGDILPALLEAAGPAPRLWLSSWTLKPVNARKLIDWRDSGVDVRCWLPSRAARRGETSADPARRLQREDALALFVQLGPAITWSPVHGKVVVVSGDKASFLVTGCATLDGFGALDLFRVRRGGKELAAHGIAMLEGLPTEISPELPALESAVGVEHTDQVKVAALHRVLVLGQDKAATAREFGVSVASLRGWAKHERLVREARAMGGPPSSSAAKPGPLQSGGGGDIPASALRVAPGFKPFRGIAASTDDLMDEYARLEMLGDLHLMVRFCWPITNPGTIFEDNWHLRELARQYMAFIHGTCAETTVSALPPGTSKSTFVSQVGPVLGWLLYPHHRWCFASHSLQQAIKDNTVRRAIIADPEFQRVFRPGAGPPSWGLNLSLEAREQITVRRSRAWTVLKGSDGKARFVNTQRGSMRATSTSAKILGDHFDRLVGDDLLDGKDRAKPEKAVDWTFNVFFTRVRDGAMKWINNQPLHPEDPLGVAKKRGVEAGKLGRAVPGGVDFLCFPHEYAPEDPERRCVSSVGITDRRTYKGELLWPTRFPRAWLDEKRADMGPWNFECQYNCNTRLEAGMLFPADKWKRFTSDPGGGWLDVSVDPSNWGDLAANDLTSITITRIVNGNAYRLAHWPPPKRDESGRLSWRKAQRLTINETVDILADIELSHPVRRWHFENKAGGKGLQQLMLAGGERHGQKWRLSPLVIEMVNPQSMGGDLKFRAEPASHPQGKGRCFVLEGEEGDTFIDLMASYPACWPDDTVASWVQQVTDPKVSMQLGHKPQTGPMPKVHVTTAAVNARRLR